MNEDFDISDYYLDMWLIVCIFAVIDVYELIKWYNKK